MISESRAGKPAVAYVDCKGNGCPRLVKVGEGLCPSCRENEQRRQLRPQVEDLPQGFQSRKHGA